MTQPLPMDVASVQPGYPGYRISPEGITLRDYFESLRRTDAEHQRDQWQELNIRLQQRFDAQESNVTTAFATAKEAVNAALIASEKAVDKAQEAQQLHNEQQNEWRGSLNDLSGRMWTRQEGTEAVASLAREFGARHDALAAVIARIDTDRQHYVTADQLAASDTATRREVQLLREDIAALRESRSEVQGASGGVTAGVLATREALVTLQRDIAGLKESRSEGAGHRQGGQELWGYIIGAAGLVGVAVTVAAHWR